MPQNMAGGMILPSSRAFGDALLLLNLLDNRKEAMKLIKAYGQAEAEREAAMAGIQADKERGEDYHREANSTLEDTKQRCKALVRTAEATAQAARTQGGKDAQETRNKATAKAKEADTHLAKAIERELAANRMVEDAEKGQKQLNSDLGKLGAAQAKLKAGEAALQERILNLDKAMGRK